MHHANLPELAMDMLLPAFCFEIKLLQSPNIIAGQQAVPNAQDASGYTPAQGNRMLASGGFQECSGLEIEMDIQEYMEGGRNNGVIRRVGRAKFQPIVLKRGLFYQDDGTVNTDLWHWMQRIINGQRPVPRCDGLIYVKSAEQKIRATWMFDRGLPAKIKGPELNGKTGEIAIEELSIAHEGLRLLPAETLT